MTYVFIGTNSEISDILTTIDTASIVSGTIAIMYERSLLKQILRKIQNRSDNKLLSITDCNICEIETVFQTEHCIIQHAIMINNNEAIILTLSEKLHTSFLYDIRSAIYLIYALQCFNSTLNKIGDAIISIFRSHK